MKRICVFNTNHIWGGGEKFNFEYADFLLNKGYQLYYVGCKQSVLTDKITQKNIPQLQIELSTTSFLNPFKVWKIMQFFRQNKIDVVIFSLTKDLKIGSIAAYFARIPVIAYRRGLAKPIKNHLVNRIIFKKILTHIIANSEETKRTILQNLSSSVQPEKIHVIYNGLPIQKIQSQKPATLDAITQKGKGIILGNAGRLTKQKGQIYLLDVASILKSKGIEFTLFIAGSGELKEELANQISERKLDHDVILLDFVENINDFMHSIDIFLLSSIWEGFGYVLVEAMLASKPVVAFDITSNPEIVDNKATGFLADYPDIHSFAEKIMLLASDETLRNKMGKEGYAKACKKFDLKDKFHEIELYLNSSTSNK